MHFELMITKRIIDAFLAVVYYYAQLMSVI